MIDHSATLDSLDFSCETMRAQPRTGRIIRHGQKRYAICLKGGRRIGSSTSKDVALARAAYVGGYVVAS